MKSRLSFTLRSRKVQLIRERGAKMGEYIKRDTAIRAVMAAKWVDGSDGAMAMEIVASPPAADVVPVVRCKDCKWFVDNNGGEWYGCKMFQVVRITPEDAPKPDDFCSYGERRGGGADND